MKRTFRILVDVGVGKNVESWLDAQGYDVVAVRDINPRMRDGEIMKLAEVEKRLILTMDKDFGELVYRMSRKHVGVLLLRMEDADKHRKLTAVQSIFSLHGQTLPNHFSVFSRGMLRIRP